MISCKTAKTKMNCCNISLYAFIYYYDHFSVDVRKEATKKFRAFLLKTCRQSPSLTKQAIRSVKLQDLRLNKIFARLFIDGDGEVHYNEFVLYKRELSYIRQACVYAYRRQKSVRRWR